MSSGTRFPIDYARRVAKQLVATLEDAISLEVVGSVRRGCETVGDMEFIAPLPREGERDRLWIELERRFYGPDAPDLVEEAPAPAFTDLFGNAVPAGTTKTTHSRLPSLGTPRRGLRQGFKYAGVSLLLKHPEPAEMAVEFYRYAPGPEGNRGWIQLIRTGPAEFSHRMVMRWQALRGDRNAPGSVDGFPLGVGGELIPVPDEETAFRLLQMPFIEPRDRTPERMTVP